MSKVPPWHSIKPYEPFVYHDETECHTGNNVEPEFMIDGRGVGRRQCHRCHELEQEREQMIAALAQRLGGRRLGQ